MGKSKADDRPPPLPGVLRITDKEAARGQLETAIFLWFREGDPSSIHTLAVAAQGVLNTMCKDRKIMPSQTNMFVEAENEKVQHAVRDPQNFFKHGQHTQPYKGIVTHPVILTELTLVDCVSMHQRLFDALTPIMNLYALRFSLFNPGAFPTKVSVKGIEIEDLIRLSRPDFLEKVLPRLRG